ncbi:MAG: lysylphosphatidylglycerol synthase transmembrane domain-containing protein, partial [Cyanobacteria bacterium J06642_11]
MKRFISIAVSTLILVILYNKIDFPELLNVFRNCNPFWMVVSLGMVVPITFFTGWRLKQLIPVKADLGMWEANKLILAASVLNMVLPSKMGDIAKSYFMKEKGGISGTLSLSIVIFEKACDMLSLLLWCAFGLLLYPEKDAFFWTMTVGILGGLIVGLLMLGSKGFARFGFSTMR